MLCVLQSWAVSELLVCFWRLLLLLLSFFSILFLSSLSALDAEKVLVCWRERKSDLPNIWTVSAVFGAGKFRASLQKHLYSLLESNSLRVRIVLFLKGPSYGTVEHDGLKSNKSSLRKCCRKCQISTWFLILARTYEHKAISKLQMDVEFVFFFFVHKSYRWLMEKQVSCLPQRKEK